MGTTSTGIVRSYCESNIGGVFDLNYLSNTLFRDIPHVNLRKIVTRLIDSGLLRQISKGVYLIGESELSDEERIIRHYTFDRDVRVGMATGGYLFYKLGLIDDEPAIKEIKTKKTVGNKRIGDIQINESKSEIAEGALHIYEITIILELIYHRVDCKGVDGVINECAKYYKDFILNYLELEYPIHVYKRLAEVLDTMGISNRVMEYYEKKNYTLGPNVERLFTVSKIEKK